MKCKCGGKTRVVDRRGEFRRRECLACGGRFSTQETEVVRHGVRQQVRTRPKPVQKFAPGTDPKPELLHKAKQEKIKSARAIIEQRREERMLRELDYDYEPDHDRF